MDFDRARWSVDLKWWLFFVGLDTATRTMYHYFSGIAGHNDRNRDIISELLRAARSSGGFDETTCENFRVWHSTIDDLRGDRFRYEEFQTLLSSTDFMLLCYCLYFDAFRMSPDWSKIPLRCSDGEVVKMDKMVAADESEVLKGYVDATVSSRRIVSRGEIPLKDFSSKVISELNRFILKKHDFTQAMKSVVGHFKGWVTEYFKCNRDILSDLHAASELLSIKGLFSLTGEAVKDLMGSSWCGNLTMSQLTSSLVAGVGDDWFLMQKPMKSTEDAPKKKNKKVG